MSKGPKNDRDKLDEMTRQAFGEDAKISHDEVFTPPGCQAPRGVAVCAMAIPNRDPTESESAAAMWVANNTWQHVFGPDKAWHELTCESPSACFYWSPDKALYLAPSVLDTVIPKTGDWFVAKYTDDLSEGFPDTAKMFNRNSDGNVVKGGPTFVINGERAGYRVRIVLPAKHVREGHEHRVDISGALASAFVSLASETPSEVEAALTIGNQ
jgi:hypothetical protein